MFMCYVGYFVGKMWAFCMDSYVLSMVVMFCTIPPYHVTLYHDSLVGSWLMVSNVPSLS